MKQLYFFTTAPYTLFFSLYLVERYFKDEKYKKVFILPSHVRNLVELSPALVKAGFEVKIMDSNASVPQIIQDIHGLNIPENATIFFNALDIFFFAAFSHMKYKAKFIMMDGCLNTTHLQSAIRKSIPSYDSYKEYLGDEDFDLYAINEVWLLKNRKLMQPIGNATIREIPLKDDLKSDSDLKNRFIFLLKQVFAIPIDYKWNPCGEVLFFDHWHTEEEYAHKKLYDYVFARIGDISNLTIKAHPSEFYFEKYNNNNIAVLPKELSNIPFQAILIMFPENFKNTKIFLTDFSTIVVDIPYYCDIVSLNIIILYNIFERYFRIEKSFLFYDEYLELLAEKEYNTFFPKDFNELYDIVNKLRNTENIKEKNNQLAFEIKENNFLVSILKDCTDRANVSLWKNECSALHKEINNRDILIKELLDERNVLNKKMKQLKGNPIKKIIRKALSIIYTK